MSTSAVTRNPVTFYTITKKRIDKSIKGDTLKITFVKLPMARKYAMDLSNRGNFKSLTNSNGVLLTI